MADDGETVYNNCHRALLQAFTARSTLAFDEIQPILAAIQSAAHETQQVQPDDVTEADLNEYIHAINTQISPLDYEIRTTYTQRSPRTKLYAFVNTTSDAFTQLATVYSRDEIAYLKRILDDMFEKYNTSQREIMAITSIQATNLRTVRRSSLAPEGAGANGIESQGAATHAQSVTVQQAEKLLSSLVDGGWFEQDREFYTLSPRALMELKGWLIETYNEPELDGDDAIEKIKLCRACGEIVTIGQRCSKRSCNCRLHDHCTRNFFRMQRREQCPLCEEAWTGRNYVGSRAAR